MHGFIFVVVILFGEGGGGGRINELSSKQTAVCQNGLRGKCGLRNPPKCGTTFTFSSITNQLHVLIKASN